MLIFNNSAVDKANILNYVSINATSMGFVCQRDVINAALKAP